MVDEAYLERLRDAPTHDAAWTVYADWLSSQGDPRGALALRQLAEEPYEHLLRRHPDLAPRHVMAAIEAHRRASSYGFVTRTHWLHTESWISWHAGFVSHARLAESSEASHPPLADLIRDLLAHASAQLIKSLRLGPVDQDDRGTWSYEPSIAALVEAAHPSLRKLWIADAHDESRHPHPLANLGTPRIGPLGALWAAYPQLREITIQGSRLDLGEVRLPRARRFALRTPHLPAAQVRAVLAADWPELEELELWLGAARAGADATIDDVGPLLTARCVPSLKRLSLANSERVGELLEPLAASPLGQQLEHLDLSKGVLDDDSIATLRALRRACPSLVTLDLRRNYFSRAGCAELQAMWPMVDLGHQRAPGRNRSVRYSQ